MSIQLLSVSYHHHAPRNVPYPQLSSEKAGCNIETICSNSYGKTRDFLEEQWYDRPMHLCIAMSPKLV